MSEREIPEGFIRLTEYGGSEVIVRASAVEVVVSADESDGMTMRRQTLVRTASGCALYVSESLDHIATSIRQGSPK
jgi:hypothetical protein